MTHVDIVVHSAVVSVIDNGDGTLTISGCTVSDNGNGTLSITGASVINNGDGTLTIS